MSAELYAVHCMHKKKVSLEINVNAEKLRSIPEHHTSLTKLCPRIGKDVTFDVQANYGVAIATTCTFTACPHHAIHKISPSTPI